MKNKNILITGGSRGIGAASAKHFADLGANIVVSYSKSAKEADAVVAYAKSKGVKAFAIQADQADGEQVKGLIVKATKELGSIDVLVNNAGIYDGKPIDQTTDAEFDHMMNINVRAVYLASREVLKHMKKGGRIINIGSVLSEGALFPGMSLYATSKFAVAGLTRALAWDLGERGITVNCVEPGPVNTDMNPENSDWAEGQKQSAATKRYSQPNEVAALIAFLASDATGNITGACYNIDGGMLA